MGVMSCYIVRAHQSSDEKPLVVSRGERLSFERRKTEWPGWIWCIDKGGRSGWVPEAWVEITGDGCRMKKDYDATELTVSAGEQVTVEIKESGWAWVRTRGGQSGWVPGYCLSQRKD